MTAASEQPLLWTVKRTAAELALSEQYIYRLVRENRIPYLRPGGSTAIRFSPAALQAWLQEREIPAARR